jgi:hypothetical protein
MNDNLLLFNDAMTQSDEKTNAMCANAEGAGAEGMTATGEICTFMCKIFKDATMDVASDFLLRWIRKSHIDMTTMQLQQRQQLKAMEIEKVQQLQIAEISRQQVNIGIQILSEEKEKTAIEIERLKESASIEQEIMKTLFLQTFEKCCSNQECLDTQQVLMVQERLEHEFYHRLAKEKNDELQALAARTRIELSSCRSTMDWLAKMFQDYGKECQEQFKTSQMALLGLIEDGQREHDAHIEKLSSQFAQLHAEKVQEIGMLGKCIEEKEACVLILSEKLTLEQSQLVNARLKHDDVDLKLAHVTNSLIFEQQKVLELNKELENKETERSTLQQSLIQERDTSAKLIREAVVMQENFRRLEKENSKIRSLNEEQDLNAQQLQHAFAKESENRSQLMIDFEKQKLESDACQLMRDKLRFA